MNERSYETLLYSITANAVAKIMELNGWSENEAMERFTGSKLYSYLEKGRNKSMAVQCFNAGTAF